MTSLSVQIIFNYLLMLPSAIALIIISVANRQNVRFSLDPLNSEFPALSFELPLFVFLFIVFVIGLLLGGFLVWMSQGKHRKALREKSSEAEKLKIHMKQKSQVENPPGSEIAPGLPVASRR